MIHSKRSLEGYLFIDHRDSPGVTPDQVPAEVVRKYGPPTIVGKGQLYESATITCVHCQAIVVLNPLRTRPRNWCNKCGDYVCDNPVCITECQPFAKLADTLQEAGVKGGSDVQVVSVDQGQSSAST